MGGKVRQGIFWEYHEKQELAGCNGQIKMQKKQLKF